MARRYLTPEDLAEIQAGGHGGQARSPGTHAGRRAGRGSPETVHSITSTPEAHSADMGRRMKVYTVQMALRVACFFGFVFIDNIWWRIACVLGMVLLPWSAVLLANAGADKSERSSSYLGPDLQPELTAGPGGPSSASDDDGAAPGNPAGESADEDSPAGGRQPGRMRDPGPEVVEGEWSDDPSAGQDR